jgi:archaemetzincin
MPVECIKLIPVGLFDKILIEKVSIEIFRVYQKHVVIQELRIDLSEYYDAQRRQYNAHNLLKLIDEKYAEPNCKTIGLFQVDIFIPIFTYIFGQAYINGKSAIASLYRLSNELYGLSEDRELLNARFCKVVLHELGHTFGLKHCINYQCIMRVGSYVEDIDQKLDSLCLTCNSELESEGVIQNEFL